MAKNIVKTPSRDDLDPQKKCLMCQQKFLPNRPNQKLCSKDCKSKWSYKIRNHKLKKFGMTSCQCCKKKFSKTNHNNIYCSIKCRKDKTLELNYKHPLVKTRFKILKKDNFTCQYCGRNVIDDKIKLQVDHIIPNSKMGLYQDDNLITSCSDCNCGKGDILLEKHQEEKFKWRNKKAKESYI